MTIKATLSPHTDWLLSLIVVTSLMALGCPVKEDAVAPVKTTKPISADFRVTSNYSKTIWVDKWKGFGFACPADGWVLPGADCTTSFPRIDKLPDSVEVVWRIKGEEVLKSQTIDLRGLVPPLVDGYSLFKIDSEGVWHAEFIRGKNFNR